MTFDEILEQAIDMLQRRGRVSYGALKRQFDLDDEYLEDLKSELIEVLEVAADKDGKMLVWNGDGRPAAPSMNTPPVSPPRQLHAFPPGRAYSRRTGRIGARGSPMGTKVHHCSLC